MSKENIIVKGRGVMGNIVDIDTGRIANYGCREHIKHCEACHHVFGYVLCNEDGDIDMSCQPCFCPKCGEKVMKKYE